jgi:hypothetical protein
VQISRHFTACDDPRQVGLTRPDAGDDKAAASELEAVKNASVLSDLSMLWRACALPFPANSGGSRKSFLLPTLPSRSLIALLTALKIVRSNPFSGGRPSTWHMGLDTLDRTGLGAVEQCPPFSGGAGNDESH